MYVWPICHGRHAETEYCSQICVKSLCNDIVESVNKALFDKEIGVSVVILDPDLFKLSIMQVNHFLLFDLDYQMSP